MFFLLQFDGFSLSLKSWKSVKIEYSSAVLLTASQFAKQMNHGAICLESLDPVTISCRQSLRLKPVKITNDVITFNQSLDHQVSTSVRTLMLAIICADILGQYWPLIGQLVRILASYWSVDPFTVSYWPKVGL